MADGVSRKRVERLMRQAGICGWSRESQDMDTKIYRQSAARGASHQVPHCAISASDVGVVVVR